MWTLRVLDLRQAFAACTIRVRHVDLCTYLSVFVCIGIYVCMYICISMASIRGRYLASERGREREEERGEENEK